jgi:septum formation protein
VLKIYLASGSPRRQALLRQLGIDFEVLPVNVNEDLGRGESPAAYAERLAREKARAGLRVIETRALPLQPVVAADTCVVADEQVLGKPGTRAEAQAMLCRLSGREHRVLTAVAVLHSGSERAALSVSRVRFRRLTVEEIERYWETGEPADKAGAYALQGRAAAFVAGIEGSHSGIVGLPLYELAQLLQQAGLDVL